MRNFAILSLVAALSAGCTTSAGPHWSDGGLPNPGSRNNSSSAQSPAAGAGDAHANSGATNEPARTPAVLDRIGRVLKCGAGGALSGIGVPALMMPYTGGLSLYLIPITVPIGLVVGLKEGLVGAEGAKPGSCS